MKLFICVLIVGLFIAYLILAATKATEPEFAVKGVLTGEKLGYMLSGLAFGAKRTTRGNGIGMRTVRKRLYAARRTADDCAAHGKTLESCEKVLYESFDYIDETLREIRASAPVFRRLPHVRGVPRLYSFCELLVKSAGGVVSRETVRAAVRSYSAETPMTQAEIASLKMMLKVALCEYTAVYAHKIVRMRTLITRGERDAAAKRIDYTHKRYNSYVYGYCTASESPAQPFGYDEDVYEKLDAFHMAAAKYNAAVSAAVRSLHTVNAFFTDEFVCSLSPVYALLAAEDDTFTRLDTPTKRMYLEEIAQKAKRRRIPEKSLASEILFRAAKDGKDVSAYILPRCGGKGAQRAYAIGTLIVWIGLAVAYAFLLPRLRWLYVFAALPIFLFAVDFVLRRIAKRTVRRRILPAYDKSELRSDVHATAVVLPCFAATGKDIDEAFEHLTSVAAANPEPIFTFGLVFDFPKADAEFAESDAGLQAQIRQRFYALPEKLRARSCVLVRRRKRVRGEEYYQGYEKKRGAVLDFNRYVLTGEGEFALCLGSRPFARYAVTLDSDTLTADCAALVCTKAHPYCKDAAVLSMRCKALHRATPYAKLYAGEVGPGRYRLYGDSIGNDVFGVGNYTGKGIYDIAAFTEKVGELFPDNCILSHDYVEGAAAGCLDSSVNAGEDFPATFADAFARDLRWLRGDWQLLPYTAARVRTKSGAKIANPLSVSAKFSIAVNLIVSLVPVAQIFVLLLTLFTSPFAFAVVLAVLPQLLRLLFAVPSLFLAPRQALWELCRCVFELAVLPTVAAYKLCAVCVTLYRLVTRRKLLEWRVFAHTTGKISRLPNAVAAIVFTASALVFGLHPFFYGVSALFLAGMALSALSGVRHAAKKRSDALLSVLTDTARQSFAYFAEQEELYRLPCDCYQEDNEKGWCARTSPTNIGMALVAYASAYEIGLISKDRLLAYTEKIVSAAEECEKYKGNLYNWYDCRTLQVLPRRFVSTVDSGNFLAALSLMCTYAEGELQHRIRALIDATDLAALYDEKRKLLYIGYDDELKTCTENHYDLLGSESTLTYLTACGYGKIPHEAFYGLNRHGVRYGNAVTVFSWTGGAFEYLMTRLFIAPDEHTLLAQAMRGAAKAQVRYARNRQSDVWGVSECRYNEFDDGGGNLYRAFGVPNIAHSRVPEQPPYAPYAAFLCLPYCSDAEFLRAAHGYTAAGAMGKYGYCESLDGGVPVKSYMSHHEGMILAACANVLKEDCLPRRLQTLPEWRTARLLCGEEPLGRARRKKCFPVKTETRPLRDMQAYAVRCSGLSVCATRTQTRLYYGGKTLLRDLHVFADTDRRTDILRGDFHATESAVWYTQGEGYKAEAQLVLLPSPLSAAVCVTYRNVSDTSVTVNFTTYAEPIMARTEDYESHPAYSRMFLQTGEDAGKCVWVRRRKEGTTVLHSIVCDSFVRYSSDKCAVWERGRGTAFGQNGNPVLSGSFAVTLGVGESCRFTCNYSVADTDEQAEYAVRLAASPDCVARQLGASHRLARAVSQNVRAMAENLLFCRYDALKIDGIGQDKPCIAYELNERSIGALAGRLSEFRSLYEMGFSFHTVLYYRVRRGEYPSVYIDAEREVNGSGIRGSAVGKGTITVLRCEDDTVFNRCKRHKARSASSQRVRLTNGKTAPYATQVSAAVTPALRVSSSFESVPPIAEPLGIGGFTEDHSFAASLTDTNTPAPWCNILSNGSVGTVLTESGGGFTFGENARQCKITEWSNDPVADPVSEIYALSDGTHTWSIPKRPFTADGKYAVVHARGYSEYICDAYGVSARMRVYISMEENRKICGITIDNRTDSELLLHALCAVRPVLGDFRSNTLPSLEYAVTESGLRLHCAYSRNEVYVRCSGKICAFGLDCENNEPILYDTLDKCRSYWGIATPVSVPSNDTRTVYFSLSADVSDTFENAESSKGRAEAFYKRFPKITFDGEFGYLTEWLPYQVYNSRFAGRTGFYQVSGAYGFRDQLQDCLALLYCRPALVREHILESARHQFKEGDVQHWWHPPAVGVRTHVCDDRLWLVYTACEYAAVTGDVAIWEESVPFLRDVPIGPQDASVYAAAEYTQEKATLWEHCRRAIEISLDFGENGLVRMRGGDWNDAMDKVGEKGVGTSVWASMFLYRVIDMFMPYVKDVALCDRWRKIAAQLYDAVCRAYGDGRFYRAYCDNGQILGAPQSPSCKIDLLSQSWSVLAGIGTAEQKQTALDTAYHLLCDDEHRIIRLFDPPFTSSEGVGYIGNYPQGVRENGGQYTQAAVWYVCALLQSGNLARAGELLRWLSPAHRCRTASDAQTYCVEPYVSAADVYGGELAGKGGWTWYTGSAAWLYKCLIEYYAGISVRGDVVRFSPHLPPDTRELHVKIRHGEETVAVTVVNSQNAGEWRVRIGEVVYNTSSLKLTKGLADKKIAVIRLPR